MQEYFVLDVEISTPMAHFSRPFEFRDLNDGHISGVLNRNRRLMFGDEIYICGGWDIVVWSISHCGSRTSRRGIQSERTDIIRLDPRDNLRIWCPIVVEYKTKEQILDITTLTHLIFVR